MLVLPCVLELVERVTEPRGQGVALIDAGAGPFGPGVPKRCECDQRDEPCPRPKSRRVLRERRIIVHETRLDQHRELILKRLHACEAEREQVRIALVQISPQ